MANLLCASGNHAADLGVIWSRVHPDNPLIPYDDDPDTGNPTPPDYLTGRILIGNNDPSVRRYVAERYAHLRGTHPLVDPAACVGPDVKLSRGVVVAPGATLLHSVTLKCHVHVNYQASMTRCLIGAYSTVSPAATICGNVKIGKECVVGAGSTICERSTIGDRVIIGAGAIIPPHSLVPDDSRVIGVWKG